MSQFARPGPDDGSPDFRAVAGRMLRAVRYHRMISQRELAELAQVRRETVERIEAGRVVPRFDTLVTVLDGGGFGLGLLDHRGRPFGLHPELDRLVDRAGRHLPAHLRPVRTPDYFAPVGSGNWWGWHRIAWFGDQERVPEFCYWHRPKRRVVSPALAIADRIWDDAT